MPIAKIERWPGSRPAFKGTMSMTVHLNANKTVAFGSGEESDAALVHGWGLPERGLVWTEDSHAVLRFAISRIPLGSALTLRASPHLPGVLGAQRVGVFGNGLFAGSRLLKKDGEITIPIPPFIGMSVLASGILDLAFDIPDCRKGSGADTRMLGFALHDLTLRAE